MSWLPSPRTSGADALAALPSGIRRQGGTAAKAAVAAAVAWELTRLLLPWAPGFYAPLVAALSVHPTVARTVRDSTQRLAAVLLGLLLGYLALRLAGMHWPSLLAVTAVAVLLSGWRRLGSEGIQVVVAALLMLLLADQPADYGRGLLAEGVVGALTAAVVNLVLVPPVHVRTAERSLTELRLAVGDVVDQMAGDVAADSWPPSAPEWLRLTRDLHRPLGRAREAVDQGSDSLRLNPRARRVRNVPRQQRDALSSLEHIVVDVRQIARTLTDAADERSSLFSLSERCRPGFAQAMHLVAGALTSYGDEQAPPDAAAARQPVESARAELDELQASLASAEHRHVGTLIAEGALLADLEQVVTTLERGPLHSVADRETQQPGG